MQFSAAIYYFYENIDIQVVSNLPDLASIGIYLAMRRHFRTQSAAAKQAQVCAIIV